jgi:hypothetical protein
MDKHEIIIIYSWKTFKKKGPKKWFGCFWFYKHSLKWFLVIPPKGWVRPWKRLMFRMWPFVLGDILQALLMKVDFKSWKISLIFGTFMYSNGEGLWNMSSSKHSSTSLITSLLGYIFTKYYHIAKKEADKYSCYFAEILFRRCCKHACMQLVKNRA